MSTRTPTFAGLVVLFVAPAWAQPGPLTVTLDTTKLMVSQAGPFYLGFQLADGSLTGDGNNAVVVSNVRFTQGTAIPPLCAANGQWASGDLFSAVALTDVGFFAYCYQGFIPGSGLTFNLSYTNNRDSAGLPDEFILVILDKNFQPIPTTGGIALLQIDFDSANPTVQTFAGDPTQPFGNGGHGIAIPAPIVSGFLPSAPALVSPANGSPGSALKTQLSWSAATGATSYDVYFGTSSPPPFVADTTATSYAPGTLNASGTYYWKVVAKNSDGSASSAVSSFSTIGSSCTFSVSAVAVPIGRVNGQASVNVSAPDGCVWTATSNDFWLRIDSASSGTGNGTFAFTGAPNAGTARIGTIAFANQPITVTQGGALSDPIFNDVPSTDPYFDYVSLMYEGGITAGCSSSPPLYCPSTPVTRAQMSVFIVAALDQSLGASLTYSPTPYFQDVPSSSIYFPFVQRIADLGITAGCSKTPALFCPDMSIPQGQMAVFMIVGWMLANNLNTFSYTPTPYFTDVPSTDIYFKFVQKMRDMGFWTGCGPTLYCESSAVTREQMAPMIMRSLLGAP